ncbi:hypothetical protein CTI12_AA572410 [Artemisia annua]|uniref:Uncharacterized protein n=1 Tax=Artemisia annua TaxID=35608 RepID=A0A2U1KS01_ARTAN|nr:hypothetical protein CTI12_AA572410 [Artemisia annua]
MSVSKLATALTIIFVVSVVILIAELVFVLWRRRSSRLQPSGPPTPEDPTLSTSDYTAKELLLFFCLKAKTRVEPSETAPTQNPNASSTNDEAIDVFKLLEASRPSRILCTIKEDDREDAGSTSISVVDSVDITTLEKVSLQECLELEKAAERAAKAEMEVEDKKTVLSLSPCDSPMFFTPLGSPSRDGFGSEFASPLTGMST